MEEKVQTGVHKTYVECLLCGYTGTSLSGHLRYQHKITAKEYKDTFGLCHKQPLECEDLTARRREAVFQNPWVINNLLVDGKDTRFTKGSDGNPFMSEQRLEIIRGISRKRNKLSKK